jgi:hypothetical protein
VRALSSAVAEIATDVPARESDMDSPEPSIVLSLVNLGGGYRYKIDYSAVAVKSRCVG